MISCKCLANRLQIFWVCSESDWESEILEVRWCLTVWAASILGQLRIWRVRFRRSGDV